MTKCDEIGQPGNFFRAPAPPFSGCGTLPSIFGKVTPPPFFEGRPTPRRDKIQVIWQGPVLSDYSSQGDPAAAEGGIQSSALYRSNLRVFMASAHSVSFLLASFGLYLGLSLDAVETASDKRMIFFGKVADGYDSQSRSQREKTLLFLKSVGSKLASPGRSKRSTESCESGPITASTLEDPLFIIRYDSVEQFDACLSNEVLKANLAPLLDHPLPNDYLAVVQRKLDEIYPDGIPDDQLKWLSYLSRLYSPEEISKWRVTSGDTLAALLSPDSGPWTPDQLKQLISTYMELGGQLTGPLLNALEGGNLCLLEVDQLRQISPESIGHAEKLDISSCSQGQKDILYEKARAAFGSQEGTSAYYPLIQPYLGGAPVEDLRKLARSQVAMDIRTFTNLKPEELKELSVQDVKDLLGVHLPGLKDAENHPSVAMWIKSHFQSELDTLGIGLQGGMAAPSLTPAGETSADGPSVAASLTLPTGASTVSAVSITAIPNPDATTFSNTRMVPSTLTDAADSYTTPLFKVIPTANETSVPVETTHATPFGLHPEAAVPSTTTVTATSEGTVSGFPVPTTATYTSITATSATTASHNPTASVTVLGVTRGVNTTTSVSTTTVSSSVTTNGTALPTLAAHSSVAAALNTTVPSTNVTTDGSVHPTIATHINITTSVNTTVASANVTSNGIIHHTVVMPINETSSPNATISHVPTLNVSHTPSTPNMSLTTSSERLPATPGPLPNAPATGSLTRAPTTSGKTPAASRRTTVPRSETSHGAAISPGPGPSHTTMVATPKRETTSRAPPKTKQPSYPTPNGYIIVRPLSASTPSPSLSCLLLTLSLAVGLSVLRGLF